MLTPWKVYVAIVAGFAVAAAVVMVSAVIGAARTWNDDDDGSLVGPSRTENDDG